MKLVMEMDFQNPNCSAICQARNNYIEWTKIVLFNQLIKGTILKIFSLKENL